MLCAVASMGYYLMRMHACVRCHAHYACMRALPCPDTALHISQQPRIAGQAPRCIGRHEDKKATPSSRQAACQPPWNARPGAGPARSRAGACPGAAAAAAQSTVTSTSCMYPAHSPCRSRYAEYRQIMHRASAQPTQDSCIGQHAKRTCLEGEGVLRQPGILAPDGLVGLARQPVRRGVCLPARLGNPSRDISTYIQCCT